ncbi:MAG: SufD family Fe-S cluster assembly protein [Polyangia bacterium]
MTEARLPIDKSDARSLARVGITDDPSERSGSFVLRDDEPVCSQADADGLELELIEIALQRHDWLRRDHYWKLVDPETDEYTRSLHAMERPQGFFLRVRAGEKVVLPAQTGLFLASEGTTQRVHNIVVLEEGSELHLITGCVLRGGAAGGDHWAVTEAYIGKDAHLVNTMVHSWGPEAEVYPHAGTRVEAGGSYTSNYVSLKPVRKVVSNPRTWLVGAGADVTYNSVIMGAADSVIDTGGEVFLQAPDTAAQILHRGICSQGRIFQRGLVVGEDRCRAHVDCSGLIIDPGEEGFISSVPSLRSRHVDAELSHEASIGKIAPEQVEYLESRGMTESQAIGMIIRGFLDTDIEGLGAELDGQIAEIAALARSAEG